MKQVFISGSSSGIGLELAHYYLAQGWRVFALSRRETPIDHENFFWQSCDLEQPAAIAPALSELFKAVPKQKLDLAVLNAGILGEIKDLRESCNKELKQIMQINMWANKSLIDDLLARFSEVDSVVAISSGAAVNGNRGWGGYSLSKAALNMLIKLYASECPETHFLALAPGLVDTRMQDYLCALEDEEIYPSLAKLKAARGSEAMPTAAQLAPQMAQVMTELKASVASGEFRDIRKL